MGSPWSAGRGSGEIAVRFSHSIQVTNRLPRVISKNLASALGQEEAEFLLEYPAIPSCPPTLDPAATALQLQLQRYP
jgi:hypothetical protein